MRTSKERQKYKRIVKPTSYFLNRSILLLIIIKQVFKSIYVHPRVMKSLRLRITLLTNPSRGLAVNFRKKCGEMRWKKIIFTAYFLHLFAVNAVNSGELFIFTAFSVFLQKTFVRTGVRTSDLLHVLHYLVHCANCHCYLSNFLWIYIRLSKLWKSYAVNFCKKCGELRGEFL